MSSGCLQALDENAFYRLWAALGDGESFLHLGVTTVRTPVKGTLKVRGLGKAGFAACLVGAPLPAAAAVLLVVVVRAPAPAAAVGGE